jgi:hypothetical protein
MPVTWVDDFGFPLADYYKAVGGVPLTERASMFILDGILNVH